jgi:hypothetical protein
MVQRTRLPKFALLLVFLICSSLSLVQAQEAAKDILGALRYRHIGPVGNRLTSVVGIPGEPQTQLPRQWSGWIRFPAHESTAGSTCDVQAAAGGYQTAIRRRG